MSENGGAKKLWWVVLWAKGQELPRYLSGPYSDRQMAAFDGQAAVRGKPDGATVALLTSTLVGSDWLVPNPPLNNDTTHGGDT